MWASLAVAAALASVGPRPSGARVGALSPSHAAVSRAHVSRACVSMETPSKEKQDALYEEYIRKRLDAGEDLDSQYDDLGADIDFDGGDSGSGAVGDGKVTLDDQHNSPFIVGGGGARDAVESFNAAGTMVDDPKKPGQKVEAAVSSRDVKQKNYWGRQVGTGYADQLADQGKWVDRPVLRQQLENWQNQQVRHTPSARLPPCPRARPARPPPLAPHTLSPAPLHHLHPPRAPPRPQSLKTATDSAVSAQTTFFGNTQEDQSTAYRKLKGRPIDSMRSELSARRASRVPPAGRLERWRPCRARALRVR